MAKKKNLSPDERERITAMLREVQGELRQIREALQARLDRKRRRAAAVTRPTGRPFSTKRPTRRHVCTSPLGLSS